MIMWQNFFRPPLSAPSLFKTPKCPRWLPALLAVLGLAFTLTAEAANWSCRKGPTGKWVCNTPTGGDAGASTAPTPAASTPATATPARAEPKPEASTTPSVAAPAPPSPKPAVSERPAEPVTPAAPAAQPVPPVAAPQKPAAMEPKLTQARPPVPVATGSQPPLSATGDTSGWSCRAGAKKAGKKGWACAPDTKGAARVAGMGGRKAKGKGPYAFTGLDEARFRRMLAVMGGDPWVASCAGRLPASALPSDYGERESSPLEIDSDYSEMEDNEIYTFIGGVDMVRADQRLMGDYVLHDKVTHTLNAHGNVIYREAGTTVGADTLFMKLDTNEGKLRNTQYIFEETPARGKAETTYFDGKKHSRYTKATFTTCNPGNDDWMMHASRLRVDKNTGRGVASNAWLEFKGVPFFYTPWISFPTDKRRQSGFLAPNLGFSSSMGIGVAMPYYWNIAPNYDATLYPRYNSRHGIILGGEFRYLQPNATGHFMGQIIPDDQPITATSSKTTQTDKEKLPTTRGFASFADDRTLLPNVSSAVRLNYVTDNRYFADMWNTMYRHDFINRTYLTSSAALNYADTFGENSVYSRVYAANYQMLVDNIPESGKPYRYLPMWNFGFTRPAGFAGGVFSLANELSNFDHSARPLIKRANVKPSIVFPWKESWGFLTPKFSLQHTQYWVDDSTSQIAAPAASIGRTTPIFSADGGLKFDRETSFFGNAYVQTLEPRLFYLYLPYNNQDDIPNVTSALYDFNFQSLFRENRFSSIDRMGDANQVSIALTSRLVDEATGREKLRINLGKLVELSAPKVELVSTEGLSPELQAFYSSTNTYMATRKDIIADATVSLTDSVKISPLVLWNYSDNRADRFQTTLHYNAGNNRLLNIGYRYRRDLVDNSDVSWSWPLSNEWSVVGRWQYAWQAKTTLESFIGVQRETCCWKFGIVARQYMTGVALAGGTSTASSADAPMSQGVFLSLELKGFANIGDSIGSFLTHSIPGYDADEPRTP